MTAASALRVLVAAVAALAALAPRAGSAAERYVAVLELTGGADRNVAGALTDRIRAAVGEALRGHFRVISRDEVVERLTKNGRACDALEDECSVELGRIVGADLVLTGRVLPVEKGIELALQLHDSVSGGLVSAESVSAAGPLDALDRAPALTQRVLRKYLAPPPPLGNPESGNYLEVRAIGSTYAPVRRAGNLRCGGPCRGSPVEINVGWRTSAGWAFEGLFHLTEYYRSADPYALRGEQLFTGGGVEWSPRASRWFALAGGAGVTTLRRSLADPGVPGEAFEGSRNVPAALAEARLKLNLRTIQVGLRAGARLSLVRMDLVSPSGARRLLAGPSWELPLTVSIRLL